MFTTGDKKGHAKSVWPWFARSCNEDRIFSLSPLDSLTPKTYSWEIFSKNSDGKAKIQGGVLPPLGVLRWIFTLGIWGLSSALASTLRSNYRGFKCSNVRMDKFVIPWTHRHIVSSATFVIPHPNMAMLEVTVVQLMQPLRVTGFEISVTNFTNLYQRQKEIWVELFHVCLSKF